MPGPFDTSSLGIAGQTNPLAWFEQYQRNLQPAAGPGRPRPPSDIPALSPEEEESALAHATSMALGGLGYVGQVMDKTLGGRAVRGLIGGHPRELLSPLPLSDTLGITNPEDIVSGRKLLENAGLLYSKMPGQTSFDWGDVAGMGTEILLDPATWIDPLAPTEAGRLFAKFGLMPKTFGGAMRGAEYSAENLARVAKTAGAAAAEDVARRGATMITPEVEKAAAEAGIDITPQFTRRTKQAGVLPAPAPTLPAHLAPPAATLGPPGTLQEALDVLGRGGQPAYGQYRQLVNPDLYDLLNVAPGAVKRTARAIYDVPTGGATPLRALFGVHLPFMEPFATFGTGPTSQAVADALDVAGNWVKRLAPVRYARALLDPSVGRALTPEGQELASTVMRPARDQAMADVLGTSFDLRREAEPFMQKSQPEATRYLRRAAEGVPVPQNYQDFLDDLQARDPVRLAQLQQTGELPNLQRQWGQMQDLGERMGRQARSYITGEHALGVETPELADPAGIEYMMRRMRAVEGRRPGESLMAYVLRRGRSVMDTSHSSQLARQDILKGFPEGSTQIDDLVNALHPATGEPMFVGPNRALNDPQAEAAIRDELTKGRIPPGTLPPPDDYSWGQAKDLSRYLRDMDPRRAYEQLGMFDPDIATDVQLRGAKSAQVTSAAEAVQEGIGRFGKHVSQLDEPGVRVPELLKQAGLAWQDPNALAAGAPELEAMTGAQEAARRLGLKGVEGLNDYAVPERIASDMTRWLKGWTRPDELHPILRAYDSMANLFKTMVTVPFMSRNIRDMVTGAFNMWRDNAFSLRGYADAAALMRGQAIGPLPHMGLTAAQMANPLAVRDAVLREVVAHGRAFTSGTSAASDILKTAGGDLPRITEALPGVLPTDPERVFEHLTQLALPKASLAGTPSVPVRTLLKTAGLDTPVMLDQAARRLGLGGARDLADMAVPRERSAELFGQTFGEAVGDWARGFLPEKGKAAEQLLNPLGVAGVGGSEDTNLLIKQMREVGDTGQTLTRLAHYLNKRRQGFIPEAAGEAIRRYHFDYGDLTPFERSVMKRVMPWYTWSARNLPPLLEDLVTRPSKLAAAIRVSTRPTKPAGEFLPDYLGEGVAIPVPGGPEGGQRYISSLGLPIEDELVRSLGGLMKGDVSGAISSALGGATPPIKLPIEMATGVQLHSGRRLEDLRPTAAGSLFGLLSDEYAHPATEFLANTPLTRFATTLDQVMDPRKDALTKAINLMSGVRVQDVDMAKQREIEIQNIIRNQLRGAPGVSHFENVYVKPENLPMLQPWEIDLLRLNKTLELEAQKRARYEQAVQAGQAGRPIMVR